MRIQTTEKTLKDKPLSIIIFNNKSIDGKKLGGIIFRLFLLLWITPSAIQGQVSLHYQSQNVVLNQSQQTLTGTLSIAVKNNNTDTLHTLHWHFWANAYKNKNTYLANELLENQTAKMRFAKKAQLGYFEIIPAKDVYVDQNETFNISDSLIKEYPEYIEMPTSILPGEELTLRLDFVLKLPSAQFNGFGEDEHTIRLSHWLPLLAKPQDADSLTPYNSKNRDAWFYNGTYDLRLKSTAPANLVSNIPFEKLNELSWHIETQEQCTDAVLIFFSQSTRYTIPNLEKDVTMHFFNSFPPFNQTVSWQRVTKFLKEEWGWTPAPKNQLVFLEKLGLKSTGSLYILSSNKAQDELEAELVDEIVQTIAREELNINPLKAPWLIEGMGNYYKHLYFETYYPDKKLIGPFAETFVAKLFDIDHYPIRYQNRMLFLYMARQGLDEPLSDDEEVFSRANYQAVVKGKTAMMFQYVRDYTGNNNFKRSMHRWLANTKGENTATDFKNNIAYYCNKNTDWILGDIYSTNNKLDYALVKSEHCSSVYTATIKNKGEILTPYSITGYKDGKPVLQEWFEGHKGKKTVQIHLEDYDEIRLDESESMPEINQKNNNIRTTGIFKKIQPLKLQFYTSFENPKKTQIFWLPSVKFNAYDKVLLGAQFYNTNLFVKPFEYRIAPDYSTGTGSLTGMASLKFNWTQNSDLFHRISFGLYGQYYHYAENLAYTRLSPTLTFYFQKQHPRSPWNSELRLRGVSVNREKPSALSEISPQTTIPNYTIVDAQIKAEKGTLLNPFIFKGDVQFGEDFSKISVDFKQRWRLTKNHLLTLRFFSGVLLEFNDNDIDPYFEYGLSGTNDYLFDYYFIGRSETTGIWSQQMFTTDGGFKSQTNTFGKQLVSGNINIPFYRFFGAFADAGYFFDYDELAWDYGIYLEFIPDFIEIYFPIQNNQSNIIAEPNYHENIRFVLNLKFDEIINRIRRGWY